jgi:hypothetical protein
MVEPVHVWICQGCGRRSYARRDPITHQRHVDTPTDYGQRREYVWCGPFWRYVAVLDTSRPKRDPASLPHLGTPSRPAEEYEDTGWTVDAEIPF